MKAAESREDEEMKGYCSLNMHVDVAASWLYMLYYSVAVYYFFFSFCYPTIMCTECQKCY